MTTAADIGRPASGAGTVYPPADDETWNHDWEDIWGYGTPAPLPPPTLTSISPTTMVSDPAFGPMTLQLTGTGFVNGATVLLGGPPVTSVTFISPTRIDATFPKASGPSTYHIDVRNPDGQQSASGLTLEFT